MPAATWNSMRTLLFASGLLSPLGRAQEFCTFLTDDGSVITIREGESVHRHKPNQCHDSEDFPCYCQPKAKNQIECPYCWIPSGNGSENQNLKCARDGESFTVTNPQGQLESCECTVSRTNYNSFNTNCSPVDTPFSNITPFNPATGISTREEAPPNISSDECFINGQIFNRGDPLGFSHDSGCAGSSFDYQCLCNPDFPSQIECPFCYFEMEGEEDALCVRDGEIINFVDQDGQEQTCGCTAPQGSFTPRPNCLFPRSSANSCIIDLPSGGFRTFLAGEPFGSAKPTRCGPDFPCYCEPSAPGGIWCPYCVYPESRDSLICAQNGESVTHTNINTKQEESCLCEIPIDPSEPPISTCTALNNPGTIGNGDGSINRPDGSGNSNGSTDSGRTCNIQGTTFREGENLGDNFVTRCGTTTEFPCFCNPDLDPPVECPYCGFALPGDSLLCLKNDEVASFVDVDGTEQVCGCMASLGSRPERNCLLPTVSVNTCVFLDFEGTAFTFSAGEPVRGNFQNTCGANYPCFCDPAAENQLSCPYCMAPNSGNSMICAEDGETITFRDNNGQNQACNCEIPSTGDPILTCNIESNINRPTESPAAVCTITADNGVTAIFEDGESLGGLVEGVCGNPAEWPSFCNAAGARNSRQVTNNQIEYPYCIFENTQSGEVVCATSAGSVTYVDITGTTVRCSCIYNAQAASVCTPVFDARAASTAPGLRISSPSLLTKGLIIMSMTWCIVF